MIKFYQEKKTGDFLCIDSETWKHYKRIYPNRERMFEGRAVCIENNINSINTAGISSGYLRINCKRVQKESVPAQWLKNLIGE